jgi:hypothetical protein
MDKIIPRRQHTVKATYMVHFTLTPICLEGSEPVYRDFGKGAENIRDVREYAKPFNGVVFSPVELGTFSQMYWGDMTYGWFEADKAFEAAIEPFEELSVPNWQFWSNAYNLFDSEEEFYLDGIGSYRARNIMRMEEAFGCPGYIWDGRKLMPCLGASE